MKRILFGIFAHPDDEAFGPAATLIQAATKGAELHIICTTKGEAGVDPDKAANLGQTRLNEWYQACALIGASAQYNLGYADGSLCNNLYHAVAEKIETLIRQACRVGNQPVELSLLTLDQNGLTGHLDHIAISYITTFVFYRLKAKPPGGTRVKELAYFCFSQAQMPKPRLDYFVFMPAGQPAAAINRRVDVSALIDKKLAAMRAHHSQRSDAKQSMTLGRDFHATDNFYVIS